jgi:hypothetical protein
MLALVRLALVRLLLPECWAGSITEPIMRHGSLALNPTRAGFARDFLGKGREKPELDQPLWQNCRHKLLRTTVGPG